MHPWSLPLEANLNKEGSFKSIARQNDISHALLICGRCFNTNQRQSCSNSGISGRKLPPFGQSGRTALLKNFAAV
jgi:hypothetical protein